MTTNPPLFVRTRHFGDDSYTHYWSQSQHAWGSLSSATIYTMEERKSFTLRPDITSPDHATYTCRHRGPDQFIPGEGEWEALPDLLKLKTTDEWMADFDVWCAEEAEEEA